MIPFENYQYEAINSLFRLIGLIPRKWAVKLGNSIGRTWFIADGKHRQIAINNLTRAFGDQKSQKQISMLARQTFQNLGQILFEIGWSMYLNPKNFPKNFKIRGLSNIKAACEKGKGVLALTAHFGNWELLSIFGHMVGHPVSILYRPLDYLPMERFFVFFRTRYGTKLIPAAHSMRKVLRCLKQGEIVAFLMDQNVDWHEGVFVDFFGHRACTNKGMALLALKTESPVVPAFLIREGLDFIVEFGSELPLIKTGDKIKDVEENTQQYNQVIEAFVRRYPDQWFWVHQRWKTPPYHPWPKVKG